MEILGFSDAASEWSDSPRIDPGRGPERPLSGATRPGQLADWAPGEVRRELDRGNFRWSLFVTVVVTACALAYFGYWLYQRPTAEAETVVVQLEQRVEALTEALPVLEEFNESLLLPEPVAEPARIYELEAVARSLFQTSGDLSPDRDGARSAATGAAEATLDGIRLASGAHAYRLAVAPVLVAPQLETDPALIALDEAARSFGAWQLGFDQVRTALPDLLLPEVTEQMDLLSAELTGVLTAYVDALRADDTASAETVLAGLSNDLTELNEFLVLELDAIQSRVAQRIAETRTALAELGG